MAEHTVSILLDVELPVSFVEFLFKQHVLTTLALPRNGHHVNGQASHEEKEDPAPVLPSHTGAP